MKREKSSAWEERERVAVQFIGRERRGWEWNGDRPLMAFMESGIKRTKNGSIKLHYNAGRRTVAVKLLYSP